METAATVDVLARKMESLVFHPVASVTALHAQTVAMLLNRKKNDS